MQNYLSYIKKIEKIAHHKKVEVFLVGGALRDLYLGRVLKDIDIVVNKRVAEMARYFADKIEASFVVLDSKRDIYRVVTDSISFDFAMMIGESIEKDLSRRDFTINAIAIPFILDDRTPYNLSDFLMKKYDNTGNNLLKMSDYIIDPYNGINDLGNKRINIVKEDVFIEDPLRLWRAIRFKSQLDFRISQNTVDFMKKNSSLAAMPAAERIKDEFVKILKSEKVAEYIKYAEDEFGMISTLIPDIIEMKATGENQHHQEDAWTHCLLVLETLEGLLLDDFYYEQIDKDKLYLLKLSALLHDIGKITTKSRKGEKIHYYGHENIGADRIVPILKQLKFSREEISFIKKIVKYHMRPMLLYIAENLTDKGRYRLFKQLGSLTPVVLIHSLADKIAAMKINQRIDEIDVYKDFIGNMLEIYYNYRSKTEDLMIRGKEIKEHLNIEEGPQIGKLLDKLIDAQAREQVKNKEEALDFLRNISD